MAEYDYFVRIPRCLGILDKGEPIALDGELWALQKTIRKDPSTVGKLEKVGKHWWVVEHWDL